MSQKVGDVATGRGSTPAVAAARCLQLVHRSRPKQRSRPAHPANSQQSQTQDAASRECVLAQASYCLEQTAMHMNRPQCKALDPADPVARRGPYRRAADGGVVRKAALHKTGKQRGVENTNCVNIRLVQFKQNACNPRRQHQGQPKAKKTGRHLYFPRNTQRRLILAPP